MRQRDPSAARSAARAHMYKSMERHEQIRGVVGLSLTHVPGL